MRGYRTNPNLGGQLLEGPPIICSLTAECSRAQGGGLPTSPSAQPGKHHGHGYLHQALVIPPHSPEAGTHHWR